jgi:hypothetical protein
MRIPALRGAYGTAEETQVSASIPIRCRKLQLGFLHLVLGQIVSISCIALQTHTLPCRLESSARPR